MRQRLSASSWTQRTPAGLPAGMPGIGEEIDGAMQHAPQPGLQSMLGSTTRVQRRISAVPVEVGRAARATLRSWIAGVGVGTRDQGGLAPGAGQDLGGMGSIGLPHLEAIES